MDYNYALPHDVNSEQAIVKEIILRFQENFVEIRDLIRESDFYYETHKKVFIIAENFFKSDKTLDYITLVNYANSNNLLESIGGVQYIKSIMEASIPSNNVVNYCKIIREKAVLRELLSKTNKIVQKINNNKNETVESIIDGAQKDILSISVESHENTFSDATELLREAVAELESASKRTEHISGLRSHYTDLDDLTLGFQPSDLIIMAGRPSMGKTTFSLSCVLNAAVKSKKNVAVFSLEMPKKQLTMKMLSALSSVDMGKIKKGSLNEHDWSKMSAAFNLFNKANVFIDDEGGLTPSQIRSRARKLKREKGLDIILIDYLQLMNPDSKTDKKNDEIGEITKSIKSLAKELNIPIILLSQLNRSLENRPDKRPKNSDLRDSGNIEQDADMIIHLYRDEVYNPDSDDKGKIEVIIGKHRNGEIGTVVLKSELQYSRFANFNNNNNDNWENH
jgi:replicative DNA helicase